MKLFSYAAKDSAGRVQRGRSYAEDEADLQKRLKSGGLYLVFVRAYSDVTAKKKIKPERVADFSRKLGEMAGAGVPLVKALQIVAGDENNSGYEKEIYGNVLKEVKAGETLSDAMKDQGEAFPTLFVNMMKSAENTGRLSVTCLGMADYYEKEHKLNNGIKTALAYPKVLSVLLVAVVIIVLSYVLPQFSGLFARMESLPVTTRILLAVSDFLKTRYLLLILIIAVLVVSYKAAESNLKFRIFTSKLELKIPRIGNLRKIVYTARFSRTLSSMYNAGVPILEALQISCETIGNAYIESQFERLLSDVRSGYSLSEAIEKVDGFTHNLASVIRVGEESGNLGKMLGSAAEQQEYEAEIAINKTVAMVEPVMIIIMAVIIGFIMISVIQPIYGSYNSIGNYGSYGTENNLSNYMGGME